ncbi:MAG: calcium/sodium antiporter [Lachnospiraceae bacterium]|nr:calcium/sodium antiporter [Lachnospiraceae bacterium]
MEILLQLLLLVVGFVLLMKGADWFVDGAADIADRLGIPQLVIGLTIVAMGTSLPEAAVSISAALKGSADITIGNVVGSNIMNVLVILGLTSVICTIPVQKSTVRYEIPFTILITIAFAAMGLMDNKMSRLEGGILWGLMIVYLIYLLVMAKKGTDKKEEEEKSGKKKPAWLLPIMVIVGAVMIVKGSDVTVDAATVIARMFGMEERFIGLTIIAFGTSLPELVTSVTAGIKGKPDIAVGNIVGSNIFNLLFVVGTTALITPVPYASSFLVDSFVAVAAVAFLFLCVVKNKKLGRLGGFLMLLGYAAFFVYIL